MKVIYKKSILEKLAAARTEARMECREIEKIILTEDEATELYYGASHPLGISVSLNEFLRELRDDTRLHTCFGVRVTLPQE